MLSLYCHSVAFRQKCDADIPDRAAKIRRSLGGEYDRQTSRHYFQADQYDKQVPYEIVSLRSMNRRSKHQRLKDKNRPK
jgi:Ni,Fe-hydrogenase III large subunit